MSKHVVRFADGSEWEAPTLADAQDARDAAVGEAVIITYTGEGDAPMRYERDGELFEVSTTHGVTLRSRPLYGVRRTVVHVPGPIPADVVASTVVELNLAGWTLVTDGGE